VPPPRPNATREPLGVPPPGYGALFLRFLRFGALAWGGPVAQIGMLQRELVDEERWVTPERFRHALAVYQVLPGPEAHELCVWFGMIARGRIGAVLAGLGFMLPGLALMLLLSWLYVESHGRLAQDWGAVFVALQAAVVALIARAAHRIGSHAVTDSTLLAIAIAAFAGALAGVHFAVSLAAAGAVYLAARSGRRGLAAAAALAWVAAAVVALSLGAASPPPAASTASAGPVGSAQLFVSGLQGGLLTFGGAYTAIPILQRDAVQVGGWMTDEQFLDGLALSGILPAPLIIFSTFVGWLGGGLLGALAVTAGIFLPAFGFTLVGHDFFERVTARAPVRRALDGVTAGVVGLIAATVVQLAPAALSSLAACAVFALSLVLLYVVKHRLNVLIVVLGAAAAGALTALLG
jgi:chromate transporter